MHFLRLKFVSVVNAICVSVVSAIFFSVVSAISAGIRGGFFKVAMARLNIRVRNALFSSIVHQEIGFFDITKTGEFLVTFTSIQFCHHRSIVFVRAPHLQWSNAATSLVPPLYSYLSSCQQSSNCTYFILQNKEVVSK